MDPGVASFNGTLAFSRLALAMLFVANLGAWLLHDAAAGLWGTLASIGACAIASAAQAAYTAQSHETGRRMQLASWVAGFVSACFLIASGG